MRYYLAVAPDLVRPHVRRVQVLLVLVEDHPVHGGLLIQLGVLHVLLQLAGGVNTVHVDEAGMVVEGISIDEVWRLLRREDEDGAGLGVGVTGTGMTAHGDGSGVLDLTGALDGVGAPLLHAGAVDVLARMVEGHP